MTASTARIAILLAVAVCLSACTGLPRRVRDSSQVRLITLDPGHFHAALVQKTMYDNVSPVVHVYAPPGDDVKDHLARIDSFNTRADNPTHWVSKVYVGDDFLEKMLDERAGDVVVISGNNRRKTRYIKACVDAGFNVLADKPMAISPEDADLLDQAFDSAKAHGVLLSDIMTERSEITAILQRQLVANPDVFGQLLPGTPDNPAVVKESTHHFFKYVAGNPIKRPWWYFDTTQQGEGIVDVTNHLVDLVMWTCFPDRAFSFDRDVRMIEARRWITFITPEQYQKVTRLDRFPDELADLLDADGNLPCYANGSMTYTLAGVHVRIVVQWNYQAPAGGGDTHHSTIRGSRASIMIHQGKSQHYRPELYVMPASSADAAAVGGALASAIDQLATTYPGLAVEPDGPGWHVVIPAEHRIGHEAHFRQVTERYLDSLNRGSLDAWEVPNMRTRYHITTSALELARQ
jgi:predicted dehydrogenase